MQVFPPPIFEKAGEGLNLGAAQLQGGRKFASGFTDMGPEVYSAQSK